MTKGQATDTVEPRDTRLALDHVTVEIEAILGAQKTTIGALKALAENDLVPLSTSLSDPVELRVNGRTVGFGEIVAVNDSFAVRVTRLGE